MVGSLAILFALGLGNFALHRAVLDSGHPLLRDVPRHVRVAGVQLTLVAEFGILVAAMLLAANGWAGAVWFYGGYFALNLSLAWLILSGRI